MKWEDSLEKITWYLREILKNPSESVWASTASQDEISVLSETYKHINEAYMNLVSIVERFNSYKIEKEPEEKPFGFADEEY